MNKHLTILLVGVMVLAFVFGVVAPSSQAVVPKQITCWHECLGGHYYECCRYVVPKSGTFIDCEYTGYLCAW
jgi:hypothetical protein